MIGDRPGDVFRQFKDHISGVLNQTITDAPLSLVHRKDRTFAQFAFRDERDVATAAPLFGCPLYLAVSQQLEVEQLPDKTWRLRTLEYSYNLLEGAHPESRGIIRWEYVSRRRRHEMYPRHHVHISSTLETSVGTLNFAKLHLSSGWVTVEEVIRFLIHEIGVKPKNPAWDNLLIDSERLFRKWTGVVI